MHLYNIYKTLYPRLEALVKDISHWISNDQHIKKEIQEWIGENYPNLEISLYKTLIYGTDPSIEVEPIFEKGEDAGLSIIHDSSRFDILPINTLRRPFSTKKGVITIAPVIVNAFQFANATTRESYIYAHAYYISCIILHGLIHYLRWRNNIGARFQHYNNPKQHSFTNADDMHDAYTNEEKYTIRCLELALGKQNIPKTIQDAYTIEGRYRRHFKNLKILIQENKNQEQ